MVQVFVAHGKLDVREKNRIVRKFLVRKARHPHANTFGLLRDLVKEQAEIRHLKTQAREAAEKLGEQFNHVSKLMIAIIYMRVHHRLWEEAKVKVHVDNIAFNETRSLLQPFQETLATKATPEKETLPTAGRPSGSFKWHGGSGKENLAGEPAA